MSLSNKKRSQLTEEVKALQNREEKHKQFKARLFLADEIQQEIEELSRLRFTGIEASFPETITTQLYQNLIFGILLNSHEPPRRIISGINGILK